MEAARRIAVFDEDRAKRCDFMITVLSFLWTQELSQQRAVRFQEDNRSNKKLKQHVKFRRPKRSWRCWMMDGKVENPMLLWSVWGNDEETGCKSLGSESVGYYTWINGGSSYPDAHLGLTTGCSVHVDSVIKITTIMILFVVFCSYLI